MVLDHTLLLPFASSSPTSSRPQVSR